MTTINLLIALFSSIFIIFLIFKNRERIIVNAKKNLLKKKIKRQNEEIDTSTVKSANNTKITGSKNILFQYTQKDISQGISRAEILIEHKEDDEAEKVLISIISVEKEHIESHILLAALYLRKKQFSRAEVLYKKINKLQGEKDPKTLSNLAFCLFELNHIEDSVALYKKALKLDENNPKRHTNLAQVLYVIKEYHKAIEHFKTALKLKPRNTNTLFMLADTYRDAKKTKLAKESYKNILEYEPYNASAREEIAKLG
ncbi:tetratricopeptide repeat protein [Candidatus Peregrinibacteria bacterium]|jgi:tetratricopeptide (TPR) repeat protein|nr:tetratricopeptide repeat protein [Candidatus Peregrinibacteria bacterium]